MSAIEIAGWIHAVILIAAIAACGGVLAALCERWRRHSDQLARSRARHDR